jgi:iron complex outermembrane receptor protein
MRNECARAGVTSDARDSVRTAPAVPDTQVYAIPFEVLITAPRMTIPLKESPAASSIVGKEALRGMPRGVAIDEALMLVPGVKVDNQANGERVHLSIRGQGILTETGIRSIKILLDEIPVNDPTGLAPDLFDVDLNTVERIEVLRGPATSLYGGGAAGGIINVVTQNSRKTPLFGDFSTVAGSNRFWKGFGQFGGDVNEVNYRVSASRTMGAGYRVHTGFSQNNVYAKATYTPGPDIQVTPIVSWVNTYHENPEGLSLAQYREDPRLPNDDAVPFNEYMDVNRTTSGVAGVVRFTGKHEIRFNGYVKHSIYTEANNHVFDHQNLTTPGTSLQYTFAPGSSGDRYRNHISLGTDIQWQTNDERLNPNDHAVESGTVLARQQVRQRGAGVFLLDMFGVGHEWNFMGSVRLDRIHNELSDLMKSDTSDNSGSADFSNLTGRVGATFSPATDVSLYGAWGEGFIPPSTEELGTNPGGYGGFNGGLTAATSRSFEAGVRASIGRYLDVDITGFNMKTVNDFDRYRMPGRGNGQEGTFYRNVGRSNRYGVEVSAEYRPVSAVIVQLAYTYSHFTYNLDSAIPILMDDTTLHKRIENGNFLPNSPQHRLVLRARCEIAGGVTADLIAESNSKAYIDGANIESEAAQGYTLLGARVSVRWRIAGLSGDLSVQGRNLGDIRYAAFTEPDPGGNSYQPGPGREFFFGLGVQL